MPYNGEGIFSLIAGYDAEPDETIQSAVWNATFEDLAAAQNAIRPISAGGTGEDNLVDFAAALADAVGDGTLVSTEGDQTLKDKRIKPRIGTTASGSANTVTPTGDASDQYNVTAAAGSMTFAAPSGTPVDGQKLILRIKDDGTSRSLSWDAIYRAIGTVLPSATTISKTVYVGMLYNAADTKWDVLAVGRES